MKNTSTAILDALLESIRTEMLTSIKNEIEVVIIDLLKKHGLLVNQPTNGYLSEKDLLTKYRTSKTFLRKVMKDYNIIRFKSGRFFMYSEASYIEACNNYRPKKPKFIKPFLFQKAFRFLNFSKSEVAFSLWSNLMYLKKSFSVRWPVTALINNRSVPAKYSLVAKDLLPV